MSCTHNVTYKLQFNSSLGFLLNYLTQNSVASGGEVPFVTSHRTDFPNCILQFLKSRADTHHWSSRERYVWSMRSLVTVLHWAGRSDRVTASRSGSLHRRLRYIPLAIKHIRWTCGTNKRSVMSKIPDWLFQIEHRMVRAKRCHHLVRVNQHVLLVSIDHPPHVGLPLRLPLLPGQ